MTADRRKASRLGGVLAAALLLAAPARAQESAGAGIPCLWDALTTAEKTRLELAARIEASPLEALLARWDERRLGEHFQRCGLALGAADLDWGARYLTARAKAEVLSSALVWEGVAPTQANQALERVAPLQVRWALAQDIMALERGAPQGSAATAVRAIAELIASSGPESRRAPLSILAAEWASARILADGLATGPISPR